MVLRFSRANIKHVLRAGLKIETVESRFWAIAKPIVAHNGQVAEENASSDERKLEARFLGRGDEQGVRAITEIRRRLMYVRDLLEPT